MKTIEREQRSPSTISENTSPITLKPAITNETKTVSVKAFVQKEKELSNFAAAANQQMAKDLVNLEKKMEYIRDLHRLTPVDDANI